MDLILSTYLYNLTENYNFLEGINLSEISLLKESERKKIYNILGKEDLNNSNKKIEEIKISHNGGTTTHIKHGNIIYPNTELIEVNKNYLPSKILSKKQDIKIEIDKIKKYMKEITVNNKNYLPKKDEKAK